MSGMIQLMSALIFIPLAVGGINSRSLEQNHLLRFSTEKAAEQCRSMFLEGMNNQKGAAKGGK